MWYWIANRGQFHKFTVGYTNKINRVYYEKAPVDLVRTISLFRHNKTLNLINISICFAFPIQYIFLYDISPIHRMLRAPLNGAFVARAIFLCKKHNFSRWASVGNMRKSIICMTTLSFSVILCLHTTSIYTSWHKSTWHSLLNANTTFLIARPKKNHSWNFSQSILAKNHEYHEYQEWIVAYWFWQFVSRPFKIANCTVIQEKSFFTTSLFI